ncbi:hypothetical protein Aduo_002336 [Ancylostoma duodenale]
MDWANDIVPEAFPPEEPTMSLTNGTAPNPIPSSPDLDVELLERVAEAAPQDVSTIPPKHSKDCVFCHGKRHISALCPDVKLIMKRADILS